MASPDEVERRLEELIERLRGTDDARASITEPRVLALQVSDLDATYWTELADGGVADLRPGEPEEAHVRIRATSDDIVAVADGELPFVAAYLSGRIRVDAGIADMLELRRLL